MHSASSHEPVDNAGRRESPPQRFSAGGVALIVFLVIALFFLVTEHRAHLFGALPYLLVLACPLMHLFHRHGHGGHHRGSTSHRSDDGCRGPQEEQR